MLDFLCVRMVHQRLSILLLRSTIMLLLLLAGNFTISAQVSITSSALTATENFTSFNGQTPLPANWAFLGSGSRGTTWNGTGQISGASGGWYGSNNVSFLGSSSASAGNATWLLQNNTGAAITQFTVSFKAQLFKTGTLSPNVKVYIASSTSSAYPAAGALTNALSQLTFNDATANISSGTVLSQTVSNLSIASGEYIFIRFIHDGGSNSDNLGWDDVSFSASGSTGSCAKPLNVAASSITNNSASISWQAPSGVSNFEYTLNTSATPPLSGTATTATSYSASTLNAATTYYFHVRSSCGNGIYSAWESSAFVTGGGSSQIKFMSFNLLNYPGSTAAAREPDYRIIMDNYMPDILVAQEISQASGSGSFLTNVLNYTSTTYSAGTFIDGPDSDNALYYKTNMFSFISNKAIATALRDINQFTLKHNASGDTLIIFSVHLKASTGAANEAARAAEADSLRKVTNTFAAGKYFLVCGDFNFYSAESAYQKLIAAGSNTNGRFNDVITMNGAWNGSANAINHTQSPRGTFGSMNYGGMDDRFDLVLFSNAIINTGGFDVVSGSYKAYGNDGLHYNLALNVAPFTYSQTLTDAIVNVSDHIPVVVTLSNSNVLPVKLSRFKARKTSGLIRLDWQTGSEKNSKLFSIERSADRKNFIEIGTVKSNGNTSGVSAYHFIDESTPAPVLYYRLKLVDQDGAFSYSEIVTATGESETTLNLYPNPVSGELFITTGKMMNETDITVTNQLGEVITVPVHMNTEGILNINTSSLSNGLYLLKITSNEEVLTSKFVKR